MRCTPSRSVAIEHSLTSPIFFTFFSFFLSVNFDFLILAFLFSFLSLQVRFLSPSFGIFSLSSWKYQNVTISLDFVFLSSSLFWLLVWNIVDSSGVVYLVSTGYVFFHQRLRIAGVSPWLTAPPQISSPDLFFSLASCHSTRPPHAEHRCECFVPERYLISIIPSGRPIPARMAASTPTALFPALVALDRPFVTAILSFCQGFVFYRTLHHAAIIHIPSFMLANYSHRNRSGECFSDEPNSSIILSAP